ncbi:hypothetical protein SESBI_30542 [Sesbania bispinosa]|nr:hypothetical protein SESBI_30542 [Sesbania bispinosa]
MKIATRLQFRYKRYSGRYICCGDSGRSGNSRNSGLFHSAPPSAFRHPPSSSSSPVSLRRVSGKSRTYTRKRTKKRKEAPSSAAVASKTRKGLASESSSKKGKETMVEVEDDPVLEELEDGDFEDSEVEEVEGHHYLTMRMMILLGRRGE